MILLCSKCSSVFTVSMSWWCLGNGGFSAPDGANTETQPKFEAENDLAAIGMKSVMQVVNDTAEMGQIVDCAPGRT